MAAKFTFFKVGDGDMTLIRLADTRVTTILVDCNIRTAADDPNDDTADVATELRKRLQLDVNDRPFVDVMLLSHPDKDHCRGLMTHFWLGKPEDYPDDKLERSKRRIIIREMWSSPLVFRRRSEDHVLCEDAGAFDTEARRRVTHWKNHRWATSGNRILIMGEDINGKTSKIEEIVIKSGDWFNTIDGSPSDCFSAQLLAPAPHDDDADLEEQLSKNESSVIMKMELRPTLGSHKVARALIGGDAEVLIWERMWTRFKDTPSTLEYDLLLAPHHCSWHTLSYDSWSKKGKDAKVSEGARNALGQALQGATIVSSSKTIKDDDRDPPCIRAKREYESILRPVDGWFTCVGDVKTGNVLELEATSNGSFKHLVAAAIAAGASTAAAAAPRAGTADK